MVKAFDGSFWAGAALVAMTLAIAVGAFLSPSLPIIGSGRGALIAVAVLGFAACAVAGIGQAPAVGWTNPAVVAGSVLGVLALVAIVAGLGWWTDSVRPVGDVLSRVTGATAVTTEQAAIAALAAIVVVKWLIGLALAVSRSPSAA